MTRDDVYKLLKAISYTYPAFKKQISTEDGMLSVGVVNEWYERLGFIDAEAAHKMYDRYLTSENSSRAPNIPYFLGLGKQQISRIFESPVKVEEWKVEFGELWGRVGANWYEYGNADGAPYYVNSSGQICRKSISGAELVIIE